MPAAVPAECPDYHVFIGIKALVVPWITVQSAGDDFLTCIHESGHLCFQSLEMPVAPHSGIVKPCCCGRMLP